MPTTMVCREVWSAVHASCLRRESMSTDQNRHPDGPRARTRNRLLGRGSWREARYVADLLRAETVGGAILLAAAVAALVWANSPWSDGYADAARHRRRSVRPPPRPVPRHLGGRRPARRLLPRRRHRAQARVRRGRPVRPAQGRPAHRRGRRAASPCRRSSSSSRPSLMSQGDSANELGGILRGWADPDGHRHRLRPRRPRRHRHAPAERAAVVPADPRRRRRPHRHHDHRRLLHPEHQPAVAARPPSSPLAAWHLLLKRKVTNPLVLAVPALLAWFFVHSSGVHATVAGVLLGLLVPVSRGSRTTPTGTPSPSASSTGSAPSPRASPCPSSRSSPPASPIGGDLGAALRDPAAIGVVVGLVVGKAIGVFGGTWAVARFTRAELDEDLTWTDVFGLSLLAGVGFTVSLLIGELAFGNGSAARRPRQAGRAGGQPHRRPARHRRAAGAQPALPPRRGARDRGP